MAFPRASGILLHPISLPSRGGIGDFGPAAYQFLDFLAAARQRWWQVLPLVPVDEGGSPYSSTSAFAGNPLLISLERLAERGWLEPSHLARLPAQVRRVDYHRVSARKAPLLRRAAATFLDRSTPAQRQRYQEFCAEAGEWLDEFVLFEALRRHHDGHSWNTWEPGLARRQPAALEQARRQLAEELEIERVVQFFFFEQWRALRSATGARGIGVMGDVAIFVSYDSADVWTHSDIFRLGSDLLPEVVAGVPPDVFSATGQRWGNPLYRWDVLEQRKYDWWVSRLRWALKTCDLLRLDHFRGFAQFWEVPAQEETAINGRWVDGPSEHLFQRLREEFGGLPFVAEDLGYITPDVHALRERLGIPGMRVLQFGFGDPGAHIYLPHRFERNTVVYTGTHDNATMLDWWQNFATPEERLFAESYLGPAKDGIHWAFIRAALGSVADLAIVPLQDVLGLGPEGRMNVPSTNQDNWGWRYRAQMLKPELAARLALLTEVSDRDAGSFSGQQGHGERAEDFAA